MTLKWLVKWIFSPNDDFLSEVGDSKMITKSLIPRLIYFSASQLPYDVQEQKARCFPPQVFLVEHPNQPLCMHLGKSCEQHPLAHALLLCPGSSSERRPRGHWGIEPTRHLLLCTPAAPLSLCATLERKKKKRKKEVECTCVYKL